MSILPSFTPPPWLLSISSFTLLDKIKIGWFLIREPMWTYGKWVRAYEELWERKFGVKHAIMVSSGSAANELIALRRKDELQKAGQWPARNKVVFPVNTWISSVSPWIHFGFEPVFVDVSPDNLNVIAEGLTQVLDADNDNRIGTVFYTALLGFFGDLEACKAVTEGRGKRFLMDNCEASFSSYWGRDDGKDRSILSLTTNSTSIFFSHFTSSGTEGGLIFTQSDEEADWYRMARSHGLTRGMSEKYRNPNVSPEFDFYLLGSNYRSSNLQAYMAILDFERALQFSYSHRRHLFNTLNDGLDGSKYRFFRAQKQYENGAANHISSIPLAIPIICRSKEQRLRLEGYLKARKVMTRPIIGGCLLAHTAFKGYGKPEDFPVAWEAHECGIYVGLHSELTIKQVEGLAKELNAL